MGSIIVIAVVGAIMSAVTGTLWYSNKTPMGKWHMQYLGFDKLSAEEQKKKMEEAKPKMAKIYSAQMLLSLLTSFFIAFVTSYSVQNGAPANAVYFYIPFIWIAFTVPMIGQNLLWGNTEGSLAWKKFISDSSYNLITYLLIAFLATLLV